MKKNVRKYWEFLKREGGLFDLNFKCSPNEKGEYKHLLQSVKSCFEEVIALNKSSSSSSTREYYLQKESKE